MTDNNINIAEQLFILEIRVKDLENRLSIGNLNNQVQVMLREKDSEILYLKSLLKSNDEKLHQYKQEIYILRSERDQRCR